MRVLQIASLAGPGAQAGGVWSVATAQVKMLRSVGTNVKSLAGWFGPLPRVSDGLSTDALVRLIQPLPGQNIRGLVPIGLKSQLKSMADVTDIVHVHLARDFVTTLAIVFVLTTKVAIVAQPHGMIRTSSKPAVRVFDNLFKRVYIKGVDVWLALTQEEKRDLVDYGVAESRIHMVTNSVPEPPYKWTPQAKPLVVFVARLHPYKQPDVFVASCISLLRQGTIFDVVVAGPDQGMLSHLKGMVNASGLGQHFSFPGALSNDEVLDLYARSWFAVTPSKQDVFPMSVVEAMSVGCPVGISKATGISKLIEDNAAGLVFEPNATALEAAISSILKDERLRLSLSARGRQLYADAWSPDRLVTQLMHIYDSAITQKKTVESL